MTSTGTPIDAKRARGILNAVITAASYGSVWATASSLRQIHGIRRIITTSGAGAPTMSFMKYFTAPPRLPVGEQTLEPAFVRRAAALTAVVHVRRLVRDHLIDRQAAGGGFERQRSA